VAIGPAPPSMAISTVGQSLCVGNDPAGTLSKVNAVTRQVEQTVSRSDPVGVTDNPKSGDVWVATIWERRRCPRWAGSPRITVP